MLRLAVHLVAGLWLFGCGAAPPDPSTPSTGETPRGAELYARYCALCHGESGEGYAADDATALAGQELLATATDRFLYEAIVRGRPGTPMSAWGEAHGGPLGEEDARAILRFMRTWQEGPALDVHGRKVAGDAERGAAIYRESCVDCHGEDGGGAEGPTLDNPVFHETASDGFIRHAIAHGRSGTPMPGFGDRLGDRSIDDLVAFIRSLRRDGAAASAAVAAAPPPVIRHPDGPNPEFSLRDDMYVPADQVKAALDAGARMVLVDARASSDYLTGHIPGAISIPFYSVDEEATRLPKDGTWIVAYCGCPHAASGRVIRALRERGFSRTAVLDEGLGVWTERGYPVTRPEEHAP